MAASRDEFAEFAIVWGRPKAGHEQPVLPLQTSTPPIRSKAKRINPGEALNKIVKEIEALLVKLGPDRSGISVERNVHLPDKESGEEREFDVLVKTSAGLRVDLTAIECRDKSRPLDVGQIEEYYQKCQACGIHHGVMVSTRGFSKAALRKAKFKNIDCFTLAAVSEPDWLQGFGISLAVIRPVVGSYEAQWNVPDDIWKEWPSGRWKFVTPFGNPFQQALERSMELERKYNIGDDLQNIRAKFFMDPDKIQILDTETGTRYGAHLLAIEIELERTDWPFLLSHKLYQNKHNPKARVHTIIGDLAMVGFEGSATFVEKPGPTVIGQINIKRIREG